MKRILVFTSLLVGLGLVLMLCAYLATQHYLHTPLKLPPGELTIDVAKGSSAKSVFLGLQQQGVLSCAQCLYFYTRLTQNGHLIAGEYELQSGMTTIGLLHTLYSGDVKRYSVTLVEGWNYAQAIAALQGEEKLRHTLPALQNRNAYNSEQRNALLKALGIQDKYTHPEGLFFPDTYQYVKGMSDIDVLKMAYARLESVLQDEWSTRAADLPYGSPYEALIMASIVEKETGVAWERAKIAGVFVRRLQKGMRLQTDPTVIYGIGPLYDGNLTRKHLQMSNAYNTYRIKGLPPSPIALAGEAAISAALHPAEGEALYFVAKGDGSHHFSASLEEHNRAVERYQSHKRVENYRSSPN